MFWFAKFVKLFLIFFWLGAIVDDKFVGYQERVAFFDKWWVDLDSNFASQVD